MKLTDKQIYSSVIGMLKLDHAKRSDRIALIHNEATLTYHLLDQYSTNLAMELMAKGWGQTSIGICFDRSFDLIISILAVLKAGGTYVPFDPSYPSERIAYMISKSEVSCVIGNSDNLDVFKESGISTFEYNHKTFHNKLAEGSLPIQSDPDKAVYILFTSGSTGEPKGVVMPDRALSNLLEWQSGQSVANENSKTLQFAPISFDVSFQEIFSTLHTGGTLVLIDDDKRLNTVVLLEYLVHHKVNRLFLPFIALQHLCDVSQKFSGDLKTLSEVITAGEQLKITPSIHAFFKRFPSCKLYNHYGPTETHVITSFSLDPNADTWSQLPPIGKPISHAEVYLLDDAMKEVKHGEVGELYLGGICLAKGYAGRPDLTSDRFVSNPFSTSDTLYKSGDIGRMLPDGNIEYIGRVDTQVKIRGYRIELGEVETILGIKPGINQVICSVKTDLSGDKKLIAYYHKAEGTSISQSEWLEYARKHLPDYMIPGKFISIDEIPKTPSGKIDRKSLPDPDTNRPDLKNAYVKANTTTELLLTSIWQELLQINPIGVEDNFFDIGGTSLSALKCLAILTQDHSIEISVARFYQAPNIKALAEFIDKGDQSEDMLAQAIQRQHQRNSSSIDPYDDAIAVIGMAIKFPGANTIDEFWDNLKNGVESIKHFSKAELHFSISEEEKYDPNYVAFRGIVDGAEMFDSKFFKMNPRVADLTDPQQRIFLQLCWNAFEDAGYKPNPNILTGVFAGTGNNSYYFNNVIHRKDLIEKVGSFLVMTSNEKDYVATKVAYELNLKGPALSIHTACSTSLVAICSAVNSLRNFECDMALAGGASVTSPINSGVIYQEGGMYSPDGHCRPFDEDAKGTLFSDGAGVVLLKRLSDAVRDKDHVYGLIRGVAINNDGLDKASFTAPSVEGQASVISMALANARLAPDEISYVETHGTATPLGDPIEVEGLSKAFKSSATNTGTCGIGSVKSNFGHLTPAAGVAGLIKTILAMKNGLLPATLHYNKNNPSIDFKSTPFYVVDKNTPWTSDTSLKAGISSFGVGGTNAHVIVESYPHQESNNVSRPFPCILLSARSDEALKQRNRQLIEFLRKNPNTSLADLAFTLQTGKVAMPYRSYVIASDLDNLVIQLDKPELRFSGKRNHEGNKKKLVFMFPGQGSQYVEMGKNLYQDEPVFRMAVDECAEIIKTHLDIDLRDILYPEPSKINEGERLLKETIYTQPALFTIGYALHKLYHSWGIKPDALIGHSIGEFVCAVVAGIMDLPDALLLIANRGKLMQNLAHGCMLSVRIGESEAEKYINQYTSVAAINGESLCVIAGPENEIEKIEVELTKNEVIHKRLHTSHAFHSPMMDDIIEPFAEIVGKINLAKPRIPIMSTVTCSRLSDIEACDPMYWAMHLRKPVRFAQGIKALWSEDKDYIMLELGPRNSASTLAMQQAADSGNQIAIPSLGDSTSNNMEWKNIHSALGKLFLHGIEPNWESYYAMEDRSRIRTPEYPFDKIKHWVEAETINNSSSSTAAGLNQEQTNHWIQQPSHITENIIPMTKDRLSLIQDELKVLLTDNSGIDFSELPIEASFFEAGLDSLFLTQVALSVSKKYGMKITFRQLNEDLGSVQHLADYLNSNISETYIPDGSGQQVEVPVSSHETHGTVSQAAFTGQPANAFGMMNDPVFMQNMLMQQALWIQQQLMAMQKNVAVPQAQSQLTTKSNSAVTPKPIADKKEVEEIQKKNPFGAIARIDKFDTDDLNQKQKAWLTDLISRYTEKYKSSKLYASDHKSHLADPRMVTGFRPPVKELIFQIVINRSTGSKLYDISDNELIDVLNGFGSNVLGYSPDVIVEALKKQINDGYEIGPMHPLAGELAKLICEFTDFDRAGFCNTGSEAVLGAMRIARTVTGKNLIVVFSNSYHGINDEVIVRPGKNFKSYPAAAGIMFEAVENVLVLEYGTEESIRIIQERADELAAVMVEPIQSRRADFQPREFLHKLREITSKHQIVYIFDEVITGFRLGRNGAQEYFGVKADIATYGKICGGGLPIGVIAGKKEYMDALDGGFWKFGDNSVPEVGVTYFAGTFVRHPFALAAGKATLEFIKSKGNDFYPEVNNKTKSMVDEINAFARDRKAPFHLVSFGTLFKTKWDIEYRNSDLLFYLLRYKGIHIWDGFPCFLTYAHSTADVKSIIDAYKEAIIELQENELMPIVSAPGQNGNGIHAQKPNHKIDPSKPPVPQAKLGKDPQGNEGWYLPDPERPGKYLLFTE